MRAVALIFLVALVYPGLGSPDSFYYYEVDDGEENSDFEENYSGNVMTMPVLTTTGIEARTRVRRFEIGDKRIVNSKDRKNIKDVLEDLLSNRNIVTWAHLDPHEADMQAAQKIIKSQRNSLTTNNLPFVKSLKHTPNNKIITWAPADEKAVNEYLYSDANFKPLDRMAMLRNIIKTKVSTRKMSTSPRYTTVPSYISTEYPEKSTNMELRTLDTQEIIDVKEALQNMYNNKKTETWSIPTAESYSAIYPSTTKQTDTVFEYDATATTVDITQSTALNCTDWLTTILNLNYTEKGLRQRQPTSPTTQFSLGISDMISVMNAMSSLQAQFVAINESLAPYNITMPPLKKIPGQMNAASKMFANFTFRPKLTTQPINKLDVEALLDIIANLTYEYDMNLTERFNETLQKYYLPTLGEPTTTEILSTTPSDHNFANTSIVAKCFVCGLDQEQIPRDSYCSDAFAGEFIPLVPVNPRARGQIASFRKYCRYLNVRGYMDNPEEPRATYGRFTGGCSVRWIDLSGVYTQRTCRNRRRAVMGKHFTSKRMAKLEMALNDVDEGCIISPMATLVPLSRGISLYARFHACVCTGAWCNRTVRNDPWILNNLILFWYFKFK